MDKVFFKRLLRGEIQIIMLLNEKVLRVKMSSEFMLVKVQLGKCDVARLISLQNRSTE